MGELYLAATGLILVSAFVIRSFYDYHYPYRGKEYYFCSGQLWANAWGAVTCVGIAGFHALDNSFTLRLNDSVDMYVRGAGVVVAMCSTIMMTWPRIQKERVRSWAGPRTEPEWFEHHELVMTGAYRIVRHPYYLGVVLSMLALTLATVSYGVFVVLVVCAFKTWRTAKEEEAMLTHTYGDEYRVYMNRTWRLIPFVH